MKHEDNSRRYTLFGGPATGAPDLFPCEAISPETLYDEQFEKSSDLSSPSTALAPLVEPKQAPWYMRYGAKFHNILDPTYLGFSMDDLGCHLGDNTSDEAGSDAYKHLLSHAKLSVDDAFIVIGAIGGVFLVRSILRTIYDKNEAERKWQIFRRMLSQLKNVRHAVINVRAALAIKHLAKVVAYRVANPLGIAMGAVMVPLAIAAAIIDNSRDEAIDFNRKLIKDVTRKAFELSDEDLDRYLDDIKRMSEAASAFMYLYAVLDGGFDGLYLYGCLFVVFGSTIATAGIGGIVALTTLLLYAAISITYKVYNEYKRQQRYSESADEASIELRKVKYNRLKQQFLEKYKPNDCEKLSYIYPDGRKRNHLDCANVFAAQVLKLRLILGNNSPAIALINDLIEGYRNALLCMERRYEGQNGDDSQCVSATDEKLSLASIKRNRLLALIYKAESKINIQSKIEELDDCFSMLFEIISTSKQLEADKEKFQEKYGIRHGETRSRNMLKDSINNLKASILQFANTYFSGEENETAYKLLQEYLQNCEAILELEKSIHEADTYGVKSTSKRTKVEKHLERNKLIQEQLMATIRKKYGKGFNEYEDIMHKLQGINNQLNYVRENQRLHITNYCRRGNWIEKSKTCWYVLRGVECVVKNILKVARAFAIIIGVAVVGALYSLYKGLCLLVTGLYAGYAAVKERAKHNPPRFARLPHFFSHQESNEMVDFAVARRNVPEMI